MSQASRDATAQRTKDGFIFSGNQQESVPRTLFLDKRLTPLERNTWQVIRMMLEPDGITALPTYEQLRPYLTTTPFADRASFETVARALSVLRLARWLSLVKKRRASDGSKLSNLYVLHDEPLTPYEAMQLDEDYFSLVCMAISHASKAIQYVATGVLDDIAQDPFLFGKRLPTRMELLLGRLTGMTQADQKLSTTHESEESKKSTLRNGELLTSESEAGLKPAEMQSLRNPNKDVRSSSILNKVLLQNQDANAQLILPQRFMSLNAVQQKGILSSIQNLPFDTQQQIFSEWNTRCQTQTVRKPVAYLFGIVQKALQGEFNSFVDSPAARPEQTTIVKPTEQAQDDYIPPTPEQREQIKHQLEALKQSFMRGKP